MAVGGTAFEKSWNKENTLKRKKKGKKEFQVKIADLLVGFIHVFI